MEKAEVTLSHGNYMNFGKSCTFSDKFMLQCYCGGRMEEEILSDSLELRKHDM